MTNDSKSDFARKEEEILKFWTENKIFEKTLEKPSPAGEFVFYEGPPTANAKPALHHLEARAFKDVIPRYKTMQGFHVRRNGGWDTHGLPVELQIEKKLGLNSKKAIEEYGIEKFNAECKQSVFEYIKDWEDFTDRIGYWVDKKNAYFTFNTPYIESLWNVLSKVNDRGLLYKDYRIVPWCSRCGTPLASHELAQGYEDVKDLSIFVKFKVIGEENTYLLAWTTTPWTLPGNVALAVGKDITYLTILDKSKNEKYILARDLYSKLFPMVGNDAMFGNPKKGNDLVGLSYEPLYNFIKPNDKSHKVYAADFITTEDGTGIVHIAPMYGQDDFELGTKMGLPKEHIVNAEGKFIAGTGFLEGRFVMEKDEKGKPTLAVDIINDLTSRGLFFDKKNYEHTYPHCWRCKTPLIYYARDSWYIRMSELKKELVEENEGINWEPSHIKEGRFGEWLREIKDWAISRERYWGTPLPIWMSEDGEKLIVDSIDTLKKYSKKSGNKYFVMRHGGTEGNSKGIISFGNQANDHVTPKGLEEVRSYAEKLKKENIEVIISSPFLRTRETTNEVVKTIGLSEDNVIFDDRIIEVNPGVLDGKTWNEHHDKYPKAFHSFNEHPEGGESYQMVKNRMTEFLYDLEEKYQNKNILIVTHGGPAWLMVAGARGLTAQETLDLIAKEEDWHYLCNGEFAQIDFAPLPHNKNFEIDLHRPFIDEVVLEKDRKEFRRVKEVMDVWFDSGAMPFAQDHYPFEGEKLLYPADFISEAIDQTRGWFYTLHAVGVLMGKGKAYKNVICLGHLLDAKGKKMSKSIGNIVNPWEMMDKYGADTLRLWMYSVNQPGDSKNFDEKTVAELHGKIFTLISNCYKFYETYASEMKNGVDPVESPNVLDKWILSRLGELVKEGTEKFDAFKVFEPARSLRDFVSDLSTWYIRRSRDRFKGDDEEDKQFALATTKHVFLELAKFMAPMTPFFAEDLYKKVGGEKESVHLENWPKYSEDSIETNGPTAPVETVMGTLRLMKLTREIVTLCLEARQKVGIKVRQPLASLTLQGGLPNEYLKIILEETNIKDIHFDSDQKDKVVLDTEITPELKREGDFREFLRMIQDLRKNQNLSPSDKITFTIPDSQKDIIVGFEDELKRVAGIQNIKFGKEAEILIEKII